MGYEKLVEALLGGTSFEKLARKVYGFSWKTIFCGYKNEKGKMTFTNPCDVYEKKFGAGTLR